MHTYASQVICTAELHILEISELEFFLESGGQTKMFMPPPVPCTSCAKGHKKSKRGRLNMQSEGVRGKGLSLRVGKEEGA